jgi:tyrosinase
MSESSLDYWREDPLLNEHHEHWHLVYPYGGRPDKSVHTKEELDLIASGDAKARYLTWHNRHGELFAYMHSQFIARYAAERLSVGLPPLVPLDNYRRPIPEGYDPPFGFVVKLSGALIKPGSRPPGTSLKDITNPKFNSRPGALLQAQEQFRDRLQFAVSSPTAPNRPKDLSEFAERVEPTDRFASAYFGALHNDGHLLIALHDDDPQRPGFLFWESATVRDPVFFRWHSHIDGLFRMYQDSLAPHSFLDLPAVEASSLSIVPASGRVNELFTEMRIRNLRQYRPRDSSGFTVETKIEYLSHEDFTYKIVAINRSATDLSVTVRIFLAPETSIDDRRAWIEMDKFQKVLAAGRNTLERFSRASSVIRHPVCTGDMLEANTCPDDLGTTPGCRCGWPYTLLLPRGTPEGMEFRFVVLLTPGADIAANVPDQNSASYCGLTDADYPDQRAMGYPFDRPFTTSLKEWLTGDARPSQLASVVVNISTLPRQF